MKKYFLAIMPLFLAANIGYAKDSCDAIAGNWTGTWRANICTWNVKAIISKSAETIAVDTYLIDGSYDQTCGSGRHSMQGSCQNGKLNIQFGNTVLNGDIRDHKIRLRSMEYDIVLMKTP